MVLVYTPMRKSIAVLSLALATLPFAASADEAHAANDDALTNFARLAEMKACTRKCVSDAVALLRSQGLKCLRQEQETVCRLPGAQWEIAVHNTQLVNLLGERVLLSATLRLSQDEPRVPAEIKSRFFPRWDWARISPPEHEFISQVSIEVQIGPLLRHVLFGSETASATSVMDRATLAITRVEGPWSRAKQVNPKNPRATNRRLG